MTTATRLRATLLLTVLAIQVLWLSGASSAAPAVLTIVHFNDAHEIDLLDDGAGGGLARVATLIARTRRQAQPTMVTFGGDLFSPAAVGTAVVDGEPLAGRQAVAVMNMLGVDWMTFGNHEFDLSEQAFRARLREKTFGIVSTNVTDAAGRPLAGTVPEAVMMLEAGGTTVRVGVIGLTLDTNPKPWVRYRPEITAAREQVARLRGRVDAIVALTHLTMARDVALVTAVPDIDLVLGGHEHENWILRRGPRLTPIMKADSNGRSAAIATLTVAGQGQRPQVNGWVEPLGVAVEPEPRVHAEIRRWMGLGFEGFRRAGFAPEATIGVIPAPLDGRESVVRTQPGALTALILASLRREVPDAAVVFFNAGAVRLEDVIAAGPVRQYDVLRLLPFGGTAIGARFDGALLARVLDAGIANIGTGGYLHVAGARREEAGWTVAGERIDPAKQYRVAFNDFLLTGREIGLGFLTRSHPQVRDVGEYRDVRLAMIDEIAGGLR